LSSESDYFKQQSYEIANSISKGNSLSTATFGKDESKGLRKLQDNVNIKFTVHYNTQPGEYICVSGSIPELGRWNLNQGQKMAFSEGGLWTFETTLRRTQIPFHYKYVLINSKTKENTYEPTPSNRNLNETKDIELKDKWGFLI